MSWALEIVRRVWLAPSITEAYGSPWFIGFTQGRAYMYISAIANVLGQMKPNKHQAFRGPFGLIAAFR